MGSGSSKSLSVASSTSPVHSHPSPVAIETARVGHCDAEVHEVERADSIISRSSETTPPATGFQAEEARALPLHNEQTVRTSIYPVLQPSPSHEEEEEEEENSELLSTASLESLSSVQVRKVRHCLTVLEASLGVSISCEGIVPYVEIVSLNASSKVLSHGGEAKGIFVVEEGALEVLAPDGGTVLNRLLPGDFCGELSTLFRVPCSAAVHCEFKVCLLRLPPSIVLEHTSGSLHREAMFQWCAKRSYIDTCSLFAARALSKASIAPCLKNCSALSQIDQEAVSFLSETATPILYSAGDKLYSSGEEAEFLFCILRGAVECSTSTQLISNRSVKYSDEGYCIGERELAAPLAELAYQARALGPVLAAPISRDVLAEVQNQAHRQDCA